MIHETTANSTVISSCKYVLHSDYTVFSTQVSLNTKHNIPICLRWPCEATSHIMIKLTRPADQSGWKSAGTERPGVYKQSMQCAAPPAQAANSLSFTGLTWVCTQVNFRDVFKLQCNWFLWLIKVKNIKHRFNFLTCAFFSMQFSSAALLCVKSFLTEVQYLASRCIGLNDRCT